MKVCVHCTCLLYCHLVCKESFLCPPAIPCQNGTVRLVGGANNYSGRVEVCVDGKWGTVCGDSFTQEHAVAVCSRLGYRTTGTAN